MNRLAVRDDVHTQTIMTSKRRLYSSLLTFVLANVCVVRGTACCNAPYVYELCTGQAIVTANFECTTVGGQQCCDQHEFCKFWQSAGECTSNKRWMVNNCQISCSTCAGGNVNNAGMLCARAVNTCTMCVCLLPQLQSCSSSSCGRRQQACRISKHR